MNWPRVKKLALGLAVFLVLIEIFQPKRTNPPIIPSQSLSAHVSVPLDVWASLIRGCGDCHSNRTRWPWYSHIAPISWLVVDDVNSGRRNMNFDDWPGRQTPEKAAQHLRDICPQIQRHGMPPISYRIIHGEARLNTQEISAICTWSRGFDAGQPAPKEHGVMEGSN